MFSVNAKSKPRWYHLRWRLSNLIVCLARWVYPENPEVTAFYLQIITDQIIYGKSFVRIDPTKTATAEPDRP